MTYGRLSVLSNLIADITLELRDQPYLSDHNRIERAAWAVLFAAVQYGELKLVDKAEKTK